MKYTRFSGLLAMAGLAALLSGCVVAPIGTYPVGAYPAYPSVYVEPAPLVIVPGFRHHGHRGYSGHGGHWR